jgi:hypothetical protein
MLRLPFFTGDSSPEFLHCAGTVDAADGNSAAPSKTLHHYGIGL